MNEKIPSKPSDQSRIEHGSDVFQQVTGGNADDFINRFSDISPDFGRFILEWEFSDV